MANQRKQKSPLKRLGFIAIFILNLIIALLTTISAYGGIINPLDTPIGAIAAMLFPGFLIFTILLLLINLIWFRRICLINIASIILIIGPLWTYCPINIFRPSLKEIEESGKPTLKVMSYNVFHFLDVDTQEEMADSNNKTLWYILNKNMDVVICQEGTSYKHIIKNLKTEKQQKEFDKCYPYHTFSGNGMGILSKYPVKEIKIDTDPTDDLMINRYEIIVNNHVITFFNLHLKSIGLSKADKQLYKNITQGDTPTEMSEIRQGLLRKLAEAFREHAKQAQIVREEINKVDGSVIICGDFNDIPGCYADRVIEGNDMTDAYRQAGLGSSVTYHLNNMYFRIDHMFYKGNLKALRTWRGNLPTSDHYPLMCIFELTD